ncbi:hypothetical protein Tco_0623645, partial [Tanacetum coccineum]
MDEDGKRTRKARTMVQLKEATGLDTRRCNRISNFAVSPDSQFAESTGLAVSMATGFI